ncbi:MAG TPA: OmpA family protein [Gemmatimonadales bacterium]|nr:OmpA family protein [Gemmatimonadales bacterium]
MRLLAALGLAFVLGSSALSAQYERRYEVGLFGAFTKYDQTFGLANKIGGGVRFAYAVTPAVSLEFEALFQPPHTVPPSTEIEPIIGGGSLVLNAFNRDRLSIYVLAGYSLLDFGNSNPYHFHDNGVHGAVGSRMFFSDRVAVRFEARGIYTPQTNGAFGQKTATHIVGSAGLAFFQADAAPALDSDRDRVGDKRDACPDTPSGATVDRRGCPSDADADGVFNGIDGCPNTPTGATVDATGCPHDQDSDKVLDGIDQCPDTPVGVTVDVKGCPPDSDGDGVHDGLDRCPDTPAGATVDLTGCPIDSDQDTVWDGLDRCPDTPIGAVVDVSGCPADTDRDGVADGIDKCPDTVAGTPVDATGCPADGDKDGVPDNLDRCPNTPAGTQVDANGCPLAKDTDGDGVVDPQDRCPGTPAGSKVDQFGCLLLFEERAPATPGAPAPRPTLILQGVNFRVGQSVLTPESYAILEQVAASLRANPEIRIEIAGYTDSTGSRLLNTRLSNNRAIAVRFALARRGVIPSRMIARGYGPANPIATNTTPEGRAQNRRVELHKLP